MLLERCNAATAARRVDVQGDGLRSPVPHQLGAHRPPGADDLFMVEGQDLFQPEALDDEQADEQRGAMIAGGCQQLGDLLVGERLSRHGESVQNRRRRVNIFAEL